MGFAFKVVLAASPAPAGFGAFVVASSRKLQDEGAGFELDGKLCGVCNPEALEEHLFLGWAAVRTQPRGLDEGFVFAVVRACLGEDFDREQPLVKGTKQAARTGRFAAPLKGDLLLPIGQDQGHPRCC